MLKTTKPLKIVTKAVINDLRSFLQSENNEK